MLRVTRNDAPPRSVPGTAPAGFTGAGVAAAFGAAACCALPILLAGAGLGTAWLGAIASITAPYRNLLIIVAAVSLVIGSVLLWRQQRAARVCAPGGACASPATRVLTLIGLFAGFVLLWLGYVYV